MSHGIGLATSARVCRHLTSTAFALLPAAFLLLAGAGPACEGGGGSAEPLILGARVAPGAGAPPTADDPLAFRRGAEALARLGFRGFFAHHFAPLDGEATLAELFEHPSYRFVLEHPKLDLFAFNVRALGEPVDIREFDGDPATREPRLAEEERQIAELAERLLADPSLAGKTVVLKFWESDWMLVRPSQAGEHAPIEAARGFVEWMRVRQAAVERARARLPRSPVTLLHAVEVNRVHDALPASDGSPGLLRAVHLLPWIAPDLVAYSAWDSLNGPDPEALAGELGMAIDLLLDPRRQVALAGGLCRAGGPCVAAALGEPRRTSDAAPRPPATLFLSEFGTAERTADAATAAWRARTVVETAARRGLLAAFAWQLYQSGEAGHHLLGADGEPSGTLLGMLRARDTEGPSFRGSDGSDLRERRGGG